MVLNLLLREILGLSSRNWKESLIYPIIPEGTAVASVSFSSGIPQKKGEIQNAARKEQIEQFFFILAECL